MTFSSSLKTCACAALFAATSLHAQPSLDDVNVKLAQTNGPVYVAEGVDGFGGGNVAASIGPDGILLVDTMYAGMVPKLRKALDGVSTAPVRIVLNTHFHGDHIQGNNVIGKTATVIAHENLAKRVSQGKSAGLYPIVSFKDEVTVRFNGENIHCVHMPRSHTDGDAVIFFETSKVLHMGDMYFSGMFPAVYREGGGDIKGLIVSLDKVLATYPADTRVIPGHGPVGSMADLTAYTNMLKETVTAVEQGLRSKATPEAMQQDAAIKKYAALGEGGAQTLPQYVAMLIKLLQ